MSFSPIVQKPSQIDLSSSAKQYIDDKSQSILIANGSKGICGWVFDIPTGENFTSKVGVSKHYTENGSVINDQAINESDEITLTGLVGELVYRIPQGVEGAFNTLTSRLGAVNAYLGPFTQGMTQKAAVMASQAAYVANQAKAIAKRVGNIVDFFKGEEPTLTLQQKAFLQLTAMQKTFQLVTVVSPWSIHYNMLITSVNPSQDESSNDYTSFSVTLQEMRFTDVKTTTFDEGNYKSAIDAQVAPAEDAGKVAGKTTDQKGILLTAAKSLGWGIAQ